MTEALWWQFLLACLVLCFTPGPTALMVTGQTLVHGRRATLPLVLGTLLGDGIALIASMLGLGALLQASPSSVLALQGAGVVYLGYLALITWRRASSLEISEGLVQRPTTEGKVTCAIGLQAFWVTALNPKSVLFFLLFFPLFLRDTTPYGPQLALLGATFFAVSALSVSCYSLAARQLRQRLSSARALLGLQRLSSLLLALACLWLASRLGAS